MKKLIFIGLVLLFSNSADAQEKEPAKLGWFINPEVGGIFHDDHFGYTLGGAIGMKFFNNHLKFGVQWHGRPGPINSKEFTITPSNDQIYKGEGSLTLRADDGSFGLFISPVIKINKIRLEIPLSIGQMG